MLLRASNISVALTDVDTCEPAHALLALASPSSPAAGTDQLAVPLRLTAVPHHVATQRTCKQARLSTVK